jgi:ABC-type Fe3+ transport system permease subunit
MGYQMLTASFVLNVLSTLFALLVLIPVFLSLVTISGHPEPNTTPTYTASVQLWFRDAKFSGCTGTVCSSSQKPMAEMAKTNPTPWETTDEAGKNYLGILAFAEVVLIVSTTALGWLLYNHRKQSKEASPLHHASLVPYRWKIASRIMLFVCWFLVTLALIVWIAIIYDKFGKNDNNQNRSWFTAFGVPPPTTGNFTIEIEIGAGIILAILSILTTLFAFLCSLWPMDSGKEGRSQQNNSDKAANRRSKAGEAA